MRIFVAGATGAIGRRLVPRLVESGYEVVALVRSKEKGSAVAAAGATPAVADPLHRGQLLDAVATARPDVVLHELTALSGMGDLKRIDKDFVLTNRFRTETTDLLLEAALAAGARRFIAQSFCGWPFARRGGPVKTEEDPLDPEPPPRFLAILEAIRYLEKAVRNTRDIEALALRYGPLYGPGTSIAKDGAIVDAVRKRKLPLVGNGAGIWSFVHVDDVAAATTAAVSRGAPGIYNVVDDDPAPVSEWLPALAAAVGAPKPKRVPAWLAKFAIGEGGVSMMTRIRGGSNAKAKRELRWEPIWPTWRTGFTEGLD
ncbi:MAG: NAD(P)-dependent oxidoreductase [Gemmatimonadota bacterium]|jgi:nucleoside-diphosphate-sugar epimerase